MPSGLFSSARAPETTSHNVLISSDADVLPTEGCDEMTVLFSDRVDAGRQLGERLSEYAGADVVVLGLPRGGVPVAAKVAAALDAPLDVIVVRKLGVPRQPELAMGAIGEDGASVVNHQVVRRAGVTSSEMEATKRNEQVELRRRARRFRGERPRLDLAGRVAIIVDDGVATGSTAAAACQVARLHGAAKVVLAVAVAPTHAAGRLAADADAFVVLETPEPFRAVSEFFNDFTQTTDAEVVAFLTEAAAARFAR